MSSYKCPICGQILAAINEDSLKALIEAHMRSHMDNVNLVKTKTSREQLIQAIKNRIKITKMNVRRLEKELKEQKGILRILYKSLEMLESEKK